MVQATAIAMMASLAGVAAFAPSAPLNGVVANEAQTTMIFNFGKKKASSSSAPAPAPKSAPASSSSPVVENAFSAGLVGASFEAQPWPYKSDKPEFDPLRLSFGRTEETISWYRAAELKHGRICMLACLGIWTQAAVTLPDETFSLGGNALDALYKVSAERPQAIVQILLAIAAVEVLSLEVSEGREAGDLKFDPLNLQQKLKLDDPAKFEKMRLKELKNGRLAMLGASAMLVQNAISGQGVWEQWANPTGAL